MSAPCWTKVSQCARAAALAAYCPPSEKESGVTFTMPITLGLLKSIEKRDVCQCIPATSHIITKIKHPTTKNCLQTTGIKKARWSVPKRAFSKLQKR
jgi:hypothetical protein